MTVFERRADLVGDMISVNKIIAHTIGKVKEDYFLQTHCTNPLITSETIDAAVQLYFDNKAQYDSLFSVTCRQSRFYNASFNPINHNPNELLRTQDLPPIYEENSTMYIFSRESFFENNAQRIGAKPYLFQMNSIEATDIDNEDDFLLAESIYMRRKADHG